MHALVVHTLNRNKFLAAGLLFATMSAAAAAPGDLNKPPEWYTPVGEEDDVDAMWWLLLIVVGVLVWFVLELLWKKWWGLVLPGEPIGLIDCDKGLSPSSSDLKRALYAAAASYY